MYQALYRKWRPRDFGDVVGQEHITETLRQQVASDRLSHAYLFVGTRGTGKTTCARILAKAANCQHPIAGNPCNECPSCLGIDNGSVLDVEELDAASNNGVDNIRALRDDAVFSPSAVRKRVYIIDEVHMLSQSAFNALLKILEEPPEHLIFILATTEIHKVPATILSRCQRYSFKRISERDIAHRMSYIAEKENIDIFPEAAELLARLADGSMRDGLSLLDQCIWDKPIDVNRVLAAIGLAGSENTERMFEFVAEGEPEMALKLLDSLYMEGKDAGAVLEELGSLCRDALISKIAPSGSEGLISGRYSNAAIKNAGDIPAAKLLYMSKTIQEALSSLDRVADRRIAAELCLMELCDERLSDDISALSSRVARLESGAVIAAPAQNKAAPKVPTPAKVVSQPGNGSKNDDMPPWDSPTVKEVRPSVIEPPKAEIKENPSDVKPVENKPEKHEMPKPETAANANDNEFRGSGNLWKDILSIAQKEIDIAPFSFLSDTAHAEGELQGGVLTVSTKNVIAKSMIDTEPVTSALKRAAEKAVGNAVAIRVTEYKSKSVQPTGKLAELKKFGNIKFE